MLIMLNVIMPIGIMLSVMALFVQLTRFSLPIRYYEFIIFG
jgi:hypothetical protein